MSRWLWLVKWLLAIPHYVVLVFLWLTFFVLTVVAFFAILITGRYPRGIFEFNVGVLRWTWRVAFYSYGALGTDRYPPFTLGEVPEYPATLAVAYPLRLSRGLVLVKWWLLAIPQYILLGIFIGSGGYAASRADEWGWGAGFSGGLVTVLVLFAGVALLFTSRYPPGIFDLVLGLDRWVTRVVAYVSLMTDAYPPFRLDQGGSDSAVLAPAPTEPAAPARTPAAPGAPAEAPMEQREGGGAGRVILIVLGTLVAIVAFGLLAGGCALVAIDQTQRDDDGFLMSPREDFASATYAIVSERADLDTAGAEWALDTFLGTVRIESNSARAVFVGIGPESDVLQYLEGVEYDVVTGLDRDPEYTREPGSGVEPRGPPADQAFWVASLEGQGEQTLDWDPVDGDWRIVVMNADTERGVSARLRIGAELDSILWIGIGLLGAGVLVAGLAALAIGAGVRRGR